MTAGLVPIGRMATVLCGCVVVKLNSMTTWGNPTFELHMLCRYTDYCPFALEERRDREGWLHTEYPVTYDPLAAELDEVFG